MNDDEPYLSPYSTPAELAAEYIAATRGKARGSESSIVEACLQGPLPGAMEEIARWRHVWSPVVAPDFDPMEGPEIALRLSVTSRGNLDVLWEPMLTQEQYTSSPDGFKAWLRGLGRQEIAQRRDNQVYFLKGYESLEITVNNQDRCPLKPSQRIEAHCLTALIHDLTDRLDLLVRAHWQDAFLSTWSSPSHAGPTRPLSFEIVDAIDHVARLAEDRKAKAISRIGGDLDALDAAWSQACARPRIKTETGRAKAAAETLGVTPESVLAARRTLASPTPSTERPPTHWNRVEMHRRDRLFS